MQAGVKAGTDVGRSALPPNINTVCHYRFTRSANVEKLILWGCNGEVCSLQELRNIGRFSEGADPPSENLRSGEWDNPHEVVVKCLDCRWSRGREVYSEEELRNTAGFRRERSRRAKTCFQTEYDPYGVPENLGIAIVAAKKFVRRRSCGTPQVFGGGGAAERKLAFRRVRFSPSERYGTYRATPNKNNKPNCTNTKKPAAGTRGQSGLRTVGDWLEQTPSKSPEGSGPSAVSTNSSNEKQKARSPGLENRKEGGITTFAGGIRRTGRRRRPRR